MFTFGTDNFVIKVEGIFSTVDSFRVVSSGGLAQNVLGHFGRTVGGIIVLSSF